MNRHALILTPLVLGGCAGGGLLDPVPFEPQMTIATPTLATPLAQTIQMKAGQLMADADGYKQHSDTLRRQSLWLDLPLMGLALGTAANGLTGGNPDATIGLGLAAGAVGATRIYFAPQTRITAYGAAAFSLRCAGTFAANFAAVTDKYYPQGGSDKTALDSQIGKANDYLTNDKVTLTTQQRTDLLAARDAALKTSLDLDTALNSIARAPGNLDTFEQAVIQVTTGKIDSDIQNLDAAIKLLTAAGPGSPSAANAPAIHLLVAPGSADIAPLLSALKNSTVLAAVDAKFITDSWAGLTNCAAPGAHAG